MALTGQAYCDVSDVINAMTSFNAAGTPAEIDPAIVQQAITQASAKVSSWSGMVWGVGSGGAIVPVPALIQSITVNIAAYFATLSYRKNKPLEANDPVLLRYQDAMSDLQAIQNGQINPDPYDPSNGSGSERGRVRNTVAKTFSGEDYNADVWSDGRLRVRQIPGSYRGDGLYGW